MHKNNFDFLRLCFALFVIITHSYVLTGDDNDGLGRLSAGQVNFSGLGVQGFFIISGFLIFESVKRSKNWFDYMVKRTLRIYPALLVVLIVAFLLAMALTEMPLTAYLQDRSAWSYIYNNLTLFKPVQYQIDNVFANNPLPFIINGSLWTIPYEFLFYIILSFGFIIKRWDKLLTATAVIIICYLFYMKFKHGSGPERWFSPTGFELKSLIHLGLYFSIGSLLASVNINSFKYKHLVLLVSIVTSLVLIYFKAFAYPQYILLPLMVIIFGGMATKGISGLNKKMGDFSYGIYLYGFPIQQTVIHFYHPTPLQLIAITMPIAIILGALSWHLIEKRALKLKKYFP